MTKNNEGVWCNQNWEGHLRIIVNNEYPDQMLLAEIISNQLSGFGIKTKVSIVDNMWFSTMDIGNNSMLMYFTANGKWSPFQSYFRIYGAGAGREKNLSELKNFNSTVKGPDGSEIDLVKLTDELGLSTDEKQKKEMTQTLAWATNQYLPIIDIIDKQAEFFINNGTRITGWPTGDELKGGLSSDSLRYINLWITEGKLKGINYSESEIN